MRLPTTAKIWLVATLLILKPVSRFVRRLSQAGGVLLVVLGMMLLTSVYQSAAGHAAQPFTLR